MTIYFVKKNLPTVLAGELENWIRKAQCTVSTPALDIVVRVSGYTNLEEMLAAGCGARVVSGTVAWEQWRREGRVPFPELLRRYSFYLEALQGEGFSEPEAITILKETSLKGWWTLDDFRHNEPMMTVNYVRKPQAVIENR